MFPAEPNKLGEMEFYLLEDLDFHLVVFHPYRTLLHICGREPADGGRFPQTRFEEDAHFRREEAAIRRRNDEEVRKAGPGSRINTELQDEGEGERMHRLMGRGTGEDLMEVNEGVLQISLWVVVANLCEGVPS